jgi:hypothetical protein
MAAKDYSAHSLAELLVEARRHVRVNHAERQSHLDGLVKHSTILQSYATSMAATQRVIDDSRRRSPLYPR